MEKEAVTVMDLYSMFGINPNSWANKSRGQALNSLWYLFDTSGRMIDHSGRKRAMSCAHQNHLKLLLGIVYVLSDQSFCQKCQKDTIDYSMPDLYFCLPMNWD